MIKIDFGSGYNPKKGFKTCDMTFSPFLDYVAKDNKIFDKYGEVKEKTVDIIHCRNVLHHIKNQKLLLKNFYRYLKKGGRLEVVECRKENFSANVFLDKVWYRFICKNENIYIPKLYRDYTKLCEEIGFKIKSKKYENEKEFLIFEK